MKWMIWWLISAVAYIVIVKIGKGGKWSDFFDSEINNRNYYWWIDFKLKAFFVFLCLVIFGAGLWLFLIMKTPHPAPSYQSGTISPPASTVGKAATHIGQGQRHKQSLSAHR